MFGGRHCSLALMSAALADHKVDGLSQELYTLRYTEVEIA